MNLDTLIAFGAYFSILLALGFVFHRHLNSASDFIMGNRSLNFWVIALSAHASDMSSWLFMAFPSAIMLRGLSQSWIAISLLLGMFLTWQLVAIRLRVQTEKYDSYTLPSFFERRFKDTSGSIRILTSVFSVIFLTFYIAAGLIAMGLLLESVFEINYYFGLAVATAVVVAYTFVGGFITVAWTDLFQALFLIAMIIIVPIAAYLQLPDGWTSITKQAEKMQVSLSMIEHPTTDTVLTIAFLLLGWGIGYFGQPHIVTKFMGIKNASELKKSKYVGMIWMCIALSAAAFVGLVGIAYFKEGLAHPELVYVEMVKSLFHPLVAGFILCGLIAASMSTMDSQILVCASVLSEDVYKAYLDKNASAKKLLIITRSLVVIVSGIALALAFKKTTSLLEAVHYAWSGLGAAFGPLLLMALYSKSANKYGAIAGIILGGLIAGFWQIVNPYITDYPVPSMIPGFFTSLAAIYVVSKLTQEKKVLINSSQVV